MRLAYRTCFTSVLLAVAMLLVGPGVGSAEAQKQCVRLERQDIDSYGPDQKPIRYKYRVEWIQRGGGVLRADELYWGPGGEDPHFSPPQNRESCNDTGNLLIRVAAQRLMTFNYVSATPTSDWFYIPWCFRPAGAQPGTFGECINHWGNAPRSQHFFDPPPNVWVGIVEHTRDTRLDFPQMFEFARGAAF